MTRFALANQAASTHAKPITEPSAPAGTQGAQTAEAMPQSIQGMKLGHPKPGCRHFAMWSMLFSSSCSLFEAVASCRSGGQDAKRIRLRQAPVRHLGLWPFNRPMKLSAMIGSAVSSGPQVLGAGPIAPSACCCQLETENETSVSIWPPGRNIVTAGRRIFETKEPTRRPPCSPPSARGPTKQRALTLPRPGGRGPLPLPAGEGLKAGSAVSDPLTPGEGGEAQPSRVRVRWFLGGRTPPRRGGGLTEQQRALPGDLMPRGATPKGSSRAAQASYNGRSRRQEDRGRIG
jgi:hypothetical protein